MSATELKRSGSEVQFSVFLLSDECPRLLQVYMGENHLEIYPGAPEIFFFCNFEYVYGKTSWKYTEIHLKSLKNYILLGKNGQIGYILMGFICIWNLDTGFLESRYFHLLFLCFVRIEKNCIKNKKVLNN